MAIGLTFFGITFAVWATKRFKNIYYETIKILIGKGIIPEGEYYIQIIPKWTKIIIFFLGEAALLLRIIYVDVIPVLQNPALVGSPGPENLNIFAFGLIRGIIVSLIWILAYLPLLSEFVSLFFGIHINLTLKLYKKPLKLEYSDPHLFSGLYPLGNLFQRSVGIYFIGLTTYLIATIGARYRFGPASTAFFLGGWILGFVLFFAPQLVIHYSMKQTKQERLETAEKRIRAHGRDDEGFLFPRTLEDEEDALNYIYDYLEYNHADKLKVYPFDVSTIRDLMLTAIIPIFAEVFIRLYFHFAGL